MDLFIHFVCDEHTSADAMGPLVTRHDGAWAYCRGHASDGHRWREVTPMTREDLERTRSTPESSMDKAAG